MKTFADHQDGPTTTGGIGLEIAMLLSISSISLEEQLQTDLELMLEWRYWASLSQTSTSC
jgi:hypothetical protein